MAAIKGLKVGLGIDFDSLGRDLDRAAGLVEGLGDRLAPVRVNVATAGGPGGKPGGGSGGGSGEASDKLAAALSGGGLAAPVTGELDRVGGAIVTMFRRIDSSMKFPKIDQALTNTEGRISRFTYWWRQSKDAGEKAGRAAVKAHEPLVPIVREITGAPRSKLFQPGDLAAVQAIGRAWGSVADRARAAQAQMALAADRGPRAGNRPGVGRALGLRGMGLSGTDKALGLAAGAADRLAAALGGVAKGGGSAGRGISRVGSALYETGRAGALSLRFWVLTPLGAIAGATVRAGHGFLKLADWVNALGDPAKRTYSQLFKLGQAGSMAKLSSGAGAATRSVGVLTGGVRKLGFEIAAALGVFGLVYKGVSALASFFTTGIKGATHLNETLSATGVTFGAQAKAVESYADGMASKFGLVKNETLGVANGFGDFASAAGMGGKQAADFAVRMTQLSADLMSFKDIPFDEAAGKIQSALAGEAEPLRRFGVLITEDAVKAYALAHGLAESSKEISTQAKVTARAALIAEGLSRANGDLERTSGEAANQFRKAGGGLENFATAVGQVLLPAVRVGAVTFNEFLATVIEVFEGAKPYVVSFAEGVAGAFERVGSVVRNLDLTWKVTMSYLREGFLDFVGLLTVLPQNLGIIGSYVANNFTRFFVDAFNFIKTAALNLFENLTNLGKAIYEWMSNPTGGFNFEWKSLTEGFKATMDELPTLAEPAWADLSKQRDGYFAEWAKREADRKASMGKLAAGPAAQAGKKADAKKDEVEHKLAAAAEVNSKEAYSTVARNAAGAGGKGMADVARTARAQLDVQRQQLQEMRRKPAGGFAQVQVMGLA